MKFASQVEGSSKSAKAERGRRDQLPSKALSAGIRTLHVFVLWGFAVVQPILSVLSNSADFFVSRDVQGAWLATVVLGMAVLPPVAIGLLEFLAGLVSARFQGAVRMAVNWALGGMLGLVWLDDLFPAGSWGLLVGAFALGVLWSLGYERYRGPRAVLTVLGPLPVLFVVLFLFFSPVRGLLFPGNAADLVNARPPARTPVVMVVFDELASSSLMTRDGRIDSARYPNFGKLASESTWYRNTATAAAESVEAVPALATGTRPKHGTLPILSQYPGSIFTLLGRSHEVRAVERAALLCPVRLCPNDTPAWRRAASLASALSLLYADVAAPDGLHINFPPPGVTWQEDLAARDPEHEVDPAHAERAELELYGGAQFQRFLDMIEPWNAGGRPPLYYIYSSMPHIPFMYLPSGKRYASFYSNDDPPGLALPSEWWTKNSTLVSMGFQRHLLQVGFADRLLGRLIRRLKASGLYDRSLIVITADHGSSYRPGVNRREVMKDNAADVGLVPLFVKQPGQKKRRVDDRGLQTVDVLPTIADLVGIKIPWRTDGRSARRVGRIGRRRMLIENHSGSPVHVSTRFLVRQRKATLERQIGLFGEGVKAPGPFGFGPRSPVLGKSLAGLMVVPTHHAKANLEQVERFRSVDRHGPFVPGLVKGRVSGTQAPGIRQVAIAVNGRIAAIGPTYRSSGEVRFEVIVPDSAFRSGENQLRVLAFVPGARTTLVSLGGI